MHEKCFGSSPQQRDQMTVGHLEDNVLGSFYSGAVTVGAGIATCVIAPAPTEQFSIDEP